MGEMTRLTHCLPQLFCHELRRVSLFNKLIDRFSFKSLFKQIQFTELSLVFNIKVVDVKARRKNEVVDYYCAAGVVKSPVLSVSLDCDVHDHPALKIA